MATCKTAKRECDFTVELRSPKATSPWWKDATLSSGASPCRGSTWLPRFLNWTHWTWTTKIELKQQHILLCMCSGQSALVRTHLRCTPKDHAEYRQVVATTSPFLSQSCTWCYQAWKSYSPIRVLPSKRTWPTQIKFFNRIGRRALKAICTHQARTNCRLPVITNPVRC